MRSVPRNLLKFVFKVLAVLSFFTSPCFAAVEKSSGKTSILPLVTFYSSFDEGEVFNWWAEDVSAGEMKTLFNQWYKSLLQQPLTKWEYPHALIKDVNPDLQVSALPLEKKLEFAKLKAASLLVTGDVRLEPSPMMDQGVRWTQKLEVFRVKNGQKITETLNIYDLPKYQYQQLLLMTTESKDFMAGTMTDLHSRIEAYRPERPEQATKLVVTGKLSGNQMDQFKKYLQNAFREVKSPQIVSYERDQLVLDVPGVSSEQLNQALVEFHWKGFLTQVISSDSSQVVFDVQSKNSLQ
jgi:hypothetical protein